MSDVPAPTLEQIRERSAAALEFPHSGFAEDSIRACTLSAMDVPVLLAALDAARSDRDALRAALGRHMKWCLSGGGVKVCAGCLADWDECPDRGLLNGGNGDDGR